MNRTMLAATLAAALAAAPVRAEDVCALPSGASQAEIAALSWLAGNWIQSDKTRTVRERWAGPYGGVLLGVGITTDGETTKSFEFFRIAMTKTGLSYFASPNAALPTEFKAVEICADKIVFQNEAHDFPQRVIYAKGANATLEARVEGLIKGKLQGEDWHYQRER